MFDYYLKFKDKKEAYEVLTEYVYEDEMNGHVSLVGDVYEVGTIYKPTGEVVVGEDGMYMPVMEALDVYHVNIRSQIEKDFGEYETHPTTPVAVFA